MDIASLIGVTGALLLIALATGGNFLQFIDLPAIAIVFGGTAMCVLAKSTVPEFRRAFETAKESLSVTSDKAEELIEELIEIGKIARYNDRWMIVLEERDYVDPFIAKAARLWVDGLDYMILKDALMREIIEEKKRFDQARDFFSFAQEIAPAMGMIGTLLGLVLMMGNMTDPRSIGPGMAVALLTTLYGAILANVVLSPLVQKIIGHGKKVRYNYELVVAAILFLHKGGDPRMLRDLMLGTMRPQPPMPEPEPEPEPPSEQDAEPVQLPPLDR